MEFANGFFFLTTDNDNIIVVILESDCLRLATIMARNIRGWHSVQPPQV